MCAVPDTFSPGRDVIVPSDDWKVRLSSKHPWYRGCPHSIPGALPGTKVQVQHESAQGQSLVLQQTLLLLRPLQIPPRLPVHLLPSNLLLLRQLQILPRLPVHLLPKRLSTRSRNFNNKTKKLPVVTTSSLLETLSVDSHTASTQNPPHSCRYTSYQTYQLANMSIYQGRLILPVHKVPLLP